MKNITDYTRCSGVLAHVTSLPSPFGIGDLGPDAYDFLRFLADARQSIWQILPLGPTHNALSNSPYMTASAFGGNPLLISPQLLFEDGLLTKAEISEYPDLAPYRVDFDTVIPLKGRLLKQAFSRFNPEKFSEYEGFITQTQWLMDYCMFMALKNKYPDKAWYEWDTTLAQRDSKAMAQMAETEQEQIAYFRFEQFLFHQQWSRLHAYAKDLNIQLFGDIPIYVSLDSADVWGAQEIFLLDRKTCQPTHVAGVPPDYFSKTGQKWGNPLYRWNNEDKHIRKQLLHWWTLRFKAIFEQVDIARIDHFRGFQEYWAVPAHHKTALKGEWLPGPGAEFFREIFAELGKLQIVAEDLGEITEDVLELRDELHFPGMRVLQFAFDGNIDNTFLPFNYETPNTFVYTGTHDNDTTVGWYMSDRIDDEIRQRTKRLANRKIHDHHGIHHDLIYLAMSSTAVAAIFPLQDILGFGSDCRMNTPGTHSKDNWTWRCSKEFLTPDISTWMQELTELCGRSKPHEKKKSTKTLKSEITKS
ncbi:4-alpha-glucanotransferase [Desulfopila inferna]|uniref:4-alpha-glucanotransferase n=1 Tax=Desulfopila inferna TaxID=468528 RepID=UPI0019628AE0|nr:4-alpha-glucanotransferase [Desulfopila inferna]MBM9603096.1 4-alpha-glucanotransferase [Desulfopila inferna]